MGSPGGIFASLLSGAAKGFAKEQATQKLKEDEEKLAVKKRVMDFADVILKDPRTDSRLRALAGAARIGKPADVKAFGEIMAQGGKTFTEDVGSALPAAAPAGEIPAIQTNKEGKIVKGQPEKFGPNIPGAPTAVAQQRQVQTQEFVPLQESGEDIDAREIEQATKVARATGAVRQELFDFAETKAFAIRLDTNERVGESIAQEAGLAFGSSGQQALATAAIRSAELNDNTALNRASGLALNPSVPIASINELLQTFDTRMSPVDAVKLVQSTLDLEYAFAGENVDQLILSQFRNIKLIAQNATEKRAYDLATSKLKFAQEVMKRDAMLTAEQLDGMSRGDVDKRIESLLKARNKSISDIAAIQRSMEPKSNTLTGKLEAKSPAFLEEQQANIDMIGFTVQDFTNSVSRYNEKLRELDGIEAETELQDFSLDATFKPLPAHGAQEKPKLLDRFEDVERLSNMENVPMSNPEKFQLVANEMADMNDGEIFNFLGMMQFAENPNELITPLQRKALETAIKRAKSEGGSFLGRTFRPGVARTE